MRLSKATKDSIAKDVQIELERSPGLTARQLARRLAGKHAGIDKSTVNSILYARPSRFFHDSSTPPAWDTTPWPGDAVQRLPGIEALEASAWKSLPQLELPLSRLNLLYGPNSAGKTSILQVLLVLRQSRATTGFILDGPEASCGSLENAVHLQDSAAIMTLGFRCAGATISKAYWGPVGQKLRGQAPFTLVVQSEDSLAVFLPRSDGSFTSFGLPDLSRWGVEPAITAGTAPDSGLEVDGKQVGTFLSKDRDAWPATLVGRLESADEGEVLSEVGLPPKAMAAFRDWSKETREIYDSTLDSVVHLGPMRPLPDRWVAQAADAPASPAVELVLRLAEDPDLVEDVNEWFDRLDIPYALEMQEREQDGREEVSLGLRRTTDSGELVRLQDLGYGVGQVLPIVVNALASHGRIILIEQPEVHLHPRLQAALADLFITSVRDYKNQLLIETHSEHLLLRLQRRIAEGLMPLDDLRVSYVERDGTAADVIPVELDSSGQMTQGWPDGFFDDRVQDLLAIMDPEQS